MTNDEIPKFPKKSEARNPKRPVVAVTAVMNGFFCSYLNIGVTPVITNNIGTISS